MDSDTESEKSQSVDLAFCIRWPENRQFKICIIYRYTIIVIISIISSLENIIAKLYYVSNFIILATFVHVAELVGLSYT